MEVARYFDGVNLKLVKEQILFSIVVDFEGLLESNMTGQMERLIRNFKKNGIYNFLSINPSNLYKEDVICFFKEAEVGESQITSNIFGNPCYIDVNTIAKAFNLETRGLSVEALKQNISDVWCEIKIPSEDPRVKLRAKKNDLQTEYKYALDINNKIVMGMAGSFDQMSSSKFTVMGALIQDKRINWPEYIYRQLVREVNKMEWLADEKKFKQKLAFGTQISWILEQLGLVKGRAETFHSLKRLGHLDQAARAKLTAQTGPHQLSAKEILANMDVDPAPYTYPESEESESDKREEEISPAADTEILTAADSEIPTAADIPKSPAVQATSSSDSENVLLSVLQQKTYSRKRSKTTSAEKEVVVIQTSEDLNQSPKRRRFLIDEDDEEECQTVLTPEPLKTMAIETPVPDEEELVDKESQLILLVTLPEVTEEEEARMAEADKGAETSADHLDEEDIVLDVPEMSYSFNLSENNSLQLTREQLVQVKDYCIKIDIIATYNEWRRSRALSFSELENYIQIVSWSLPITLEQMVMEFCREKDVICLLSTNIFQTRFQTSMDNLIFDLMGSVSRNESVDDFHVKSISMLENVKDGVEKLSEEKKRVEKVVILDEEVENVEEVENNKVEKQKESIEEKREERKETEEEEDEEEEVEEKEKEGVEKKREDGDDQNPPDQANPPAQSSSSSSGSSRPKTQGEPANPPEAREPTSSQKSHSSVPEPNQSLNTQTPSYLPPNLSDLIRSIVAEELSKVFSSSSDPKFLSLEKKIDTLSDEIKPELKCLNSKMDTLLNMKEPSPTPTSSRMPFGLADFMSRVESQLAIIADGKKGEEKDDDDDRLHEFRTKRRQEESSKLALTGPGSSTQKRMADDKSVEVPAPKRQRTLGPHISIPRDHVPLEWEGLELCEVEGFLPLEHEKLWGIAKKEFIEKYYLMEILQDKEHKPQEIFINYMAMEYPTLWEALKKEAEKKFKYYPMIPEFRPKEPPTLQNGKLDEDALQREIAKQCISQKASTQEAQEFIAQTIRRKYGLLPVTNRPIGAKPFRGAVGRGSSRGKAKSRRMLG
ncbi:hypothetical protein OROGR_009008 [Orobanche gracilis]